MISNKNIRFCIFIFILFFYLRSVTVTLLTKDAEWNSRIIGGHKILKIKGPLTITITSRSLRAFTRNYGFLISLRPFTEIPLCFYLFYFFLRHKAKTLTLATILLLLGDRPLRSPALKRKLNRNTKWKCSVVTVNGYDLEQPAWKMCNWINLRTTNAISESYEEYLHVYRERMRVIDSIRVLDSQMIYFIDRDIIDRQSTPSIFDSNGHLVLVGDKTRFPNVRDNQIFIKGEKGKRLYADLIRNAELISKGTPEMGFSHLYLNGYFKKRNITVLDVPEVIHCPSTSWDRLSCLYQREEQRSIPFKAVYKAFLYLSISRVIFSLTSYCFINRKRIHCHCCMSKPFLLAVEAFIVLKLSFATLSYNALAIYVFCWITLDFWHSTWRQFKGKCSIEEECYLYQPTVRI